MCDLSVTDDGEGEDPEADLHELLRLLRVAAEEPIEGMDDVDALKEALETTQDLAARIQAVLNDFGWPDHG